MDTPVEKLLRLLTDAKAHPAKSSDQFFSNVWLAGATIPASELRNIIEDYYNFIEPKQSVDRKNFSRATLALAFLEFNDGKYELALSHSFNAQKLFQEINDLDGMHACSTTIAFNYRSLGEIELAVKYLLDGLKQFSVKGDFEIFRAFGLYNLAEIYSETNQLDEALINYNLAIQVSEEFGHEGMTARVLAGMGTLFLHQKKYSLALDYLNQSLETCETTHSVIVKARVLTDLGNYYKETGDYQTAVSYHQQALELRESLKLPNAMVTNLIHLGELQRIQGKLDDAIVLLTRALTMAEQLKVKQKIFQLHEILSDIYQAKSDSAKCLFHYRAFHRIRDEVLHEDNERKIKNLHLVFAAEQTQKENAIIKSQKAEIERKNVQLQHTVDELTRTRVSRKAKAITLVVAVLLFLIQEVVLHLTHEIYTQNNLILSLSIKGAILISLKPIENLIESTMLKKIMKEKI